MLFEPQVVQRAFGFPTFRKGLDYHAQGRVVEFNLTDRTLTGTVIGSNGRSYEVTLRANRDGWPEGVCTCPVGFNCKHAAALAIAAKNDRTKSGRDAADGAVDSWIEALAGAGMEGAPAAAREHLRYAIDMQERYYVPAFTLCAFAVAVLKSGALGSPRVHDLRSVEYSNAKPIVQVDRTISRLASAAGVLGGMRETSPILLGTLMEILIGTQRLHWQSVHTQPLARKPLDGVEIEWRLESDGRQRARIAGRSAAVLLPTTPLWYVDPQRCEAGPASTALPRELEPLLGAAPSLTPQQARRVQIQAGSVFGAAGIAGPHAALDVQIIRDDPTPVLRLSAYVPPKNAIYAASETFATAELLFTYGKEIIRPRDARREIRSSSKNSASTWPRKIGFERSAAARLEAEGLAAVGWPYVQYVDAQSAPLHFPGESERLWMRFLSGTVPQLREEGWRIETEDAFPYAIVQPGEDWHGDILGGEDSPWFELDLGIDIEGERIALLPLLLDALRQNGITATTDLQTLAERREPILAQLSGGKYVALPAARVARLLGTLADLFERDDPLTSQGRLQLAPVQAAALDNLKNAAEVHWRTDSSLRDFFEALAHLDGNAFATPQQFGGVLRPYQRDGAAWLGALHAHGFGGVLADDMGLGKTVQFLAHVCAQKAAGRLAHPVLIVSPTSVVPNWRAEIARFAPHLRVVSLTGWDREVRFSQIIDADIALTTYALLPRDAEQILDRQWSIAVLDEAQAVKNPRSKAALAARQVRAKQRIALTGTPIENHLEELWSIYAFALPELLGDRTRFARTFRTPIEKRGDSLRRSALAARLRPFFLRRTKESVERDLPPKTEIVQRIELAGAQRDLYETIRLAMHKRVREEILRRGLARSRIVVLDALLKLRQVCCDPRLVKLPAAANVKDSQKLTALLEMLESLLDDGRRVLLFSQFTSMLDLIKPELFKRHRDFVELRGDTRDRETPVLRFQRREVPLFLISLKAGGTGLNLTAADTVIHYDPWWNPAVERQATDRAHRIGQEQHVFIYKLIAEGTVEERILELQERKAQLASSLFDETSSAPLQLDLADVERLFS